MVAKYNKNKKESWQNVFFPGLVAVLLLGVIGFLVFSDLKINKKRVELNKKIEELRQEIQALEQNNQKLKAGLSDTESEAYWEGKAREQGYKKPGEEQVVVLPPEESQTGVEEKKGFWQSLLGKLGF